MKYFLALIATLLLFSACKKDESSDAIEHTVLVYIAADNNLSGYVPGNIRQMMKGSMQLTDNCRLIVFVDLPQKQPYFLQITKGDTVRLKTFDQELKTSDPETLRMALAWTMENFTCNDYGLVLWGHSDGWPLKQQQPAASSQARRAYGVDTSGGETWMDIPDMARVLASLPHSLRFIFADCCSFQSIESAYELRNVTDYIIGSAAEIPAQGAPYETIVPALFNTSDIFYENIADIYHDQMVSNNYEPMSVIKTCKLKDLADATRTALMESQSTLRVEDGRFPDVEGIIYYFCHTQFDMQDFMLHHTGDQTYQEWKRSYDETVVYKKMAPIWLANFVPYVDKTYTSFRDFTVTEERYGGVSMFVPQDPEIVYTDYLIKSPGAYNMASYCRNAARLQNERISRMQWYEAIGLNQLGW